MKPYRSHMELYWHTPVALNVAAGTHLGPRWAASSASAAVQSSHRGRQAAVRRVLSGRTADELARPRPAGPPPLPNHRGRPGGGPEPPGTPRCRAQTSAARKTEGKPA